MSTEIRAPIVIKGWVCLRDLNIDRIEVDRTDWEWGPIPYVSEYGEDTDVLVFRDLSEPDPAKRDRIEADVNITEPVHTLIDAHDVSAHRWMAGPVDLDDVTEVLERLDRLYHEDVMQWVLAKAGS